MDITKEKFLELVKEGHKDVVTLEMMVELESSLSSEDYIKYNAMVESNRKSPVVAWILTALLYSFGASLIYLGLKGPRLICFILLIVGWITIYFLIGIFFIIGAGIWSIFLTYYGLKENLLETKIDTYYQLFS